MPIGQPLPIGPSIDIDPTEEDFTPSGDVAALADGGFVAVFERQLPSDERQAFAQIFDANGSPIGAAIRLQLDQIPGRGELLFVKARPDGGFIVGGNVEGIGAAFGVFDAGGNPLTGPVAASTSNRDSLHDIAVFDDGSFVAVFQRGLDANGDDIFARRFDADGDPIGAPFLVNNTFRPGNQENPSVAVLDGGGFVVAWEVNQSIRSIRAQVYDAAGSRVGGEITVTADTNDDSDSNPSITALGNGFVVAWGEGNDGIAGQIYDADRNPIGPQFTAGEFTDPTEVEVKALPDGSGFLAIWHTSVTTAGGFVRGQLFDAAGNKIGGWFRIEDDRQDQAVGDLDILADGTIVVTFADYTVTPPFGPLAGDYRARFFELPNLIEGNEAVNDTLAGTEGLDLIRGLGGNDVLSGLGDYDLIEGGAGIDRIDGGAGDDTLRGEADNDRLLGGADDDLAFGGDGGDRIAGDIGADELYGELGNDTMFGHAQNDTMSGGDHDDRLDGGSANDLLMGGVGADTLFGGIGADEVRGGQGSDRVYGDAGADILAGGLADDLLFGGALDGAADVFAFQVGSGRDLVYDFEDGIDKLNLADFNYNDFDDINTADVAGGRMRIYLNTGDQIIVQNFSTAQFEEGDVIL